MLYNFIYKEDKEILYNNYNNLNDQIFIYSTNNTFTGFSYYNFYFLFGYINPYNTLNNKQYFFYEHIFPSVDIRFEFENHIFTISPLILYEKENLFFKDRELTNIIINHYYKSNLKKYSNIFFNSNSYKLNYYFYSTYLSFYFGFYYIDQKNDYSNKKNYIDINYYDYRIQISTNFFWIVFKITNTNGFFYVANQYYKILGYSYNVTIIFYNKYLDIILDLKKSTPSKWNIYKNNWDYYGYTSIFDEFLFTPHFSSSFDISTNYEICYNPDYLCDGINTINSELNFKNPSNSYYLKTKYKFSFLDIIFSCGYILKKQNQNKNLNLFIYYNENLNQTEFRKKSKLEYIEPMIQFNFKHINNNIIIEYSQFYKKQNTDRFQYVSKNISISFIYYL